MLTCFNPVNLRIYFQGNDPFRPNPEQDRQVWSIWTELMEETVEELSDMTARLVIRGFVNSYLQTRREEQQTALDPLSAVLEDYINEVADAGAPRIGKLELQVSMSTPYSRR